MNCIFIKRTFDSDSVHYMGHDEDTVREEIGKFLETVISDMLHSRPTFPQDRTFTLCVSDLSVDEIAALPEVDEG